CGHGASTVTGGAASEPGLAPWLTSSSRSCTAASVPPSRSPRSVAPSAAPQWQLQYPLSHTDRNELLTEALHAALRSVSARAPARVAAAGREPAAAGRAAAATDPGRGGSRATGRSRCAWASSSRALARGSPGRAAGKRAFAHQARWVRASRPGSARFHCQGGSMGITASLLLTAVGAVLLWGVEADVSGVNIHTIGVILLVVGIAGFVISLFFWSSWGGFGGGRDTTVVRERDTIDRV